MQLFLCSLLLPPFIQCRVRSLFSLAESQALNYLLLLTLNIYWATEVFNSIDTLGLGLQLQCRRLNMWISLDNFCFKRTLPYLLFRCTTAEKWNIWDFHTFSYHMDFHPQEKNIYPYYLISSDSFLYFSFRL